MSEDQLNLPIPAESDGFDETETGDRVIQGTLLKCVDGKWTDRDGSPPPETPLLALSTLTIAQHLQDQKPIETIVKRPGQPFPDVDDLNAEIPQSEWEEGLNGPRPPWQEQKVVYFLCEATAERFTFASGTVGANIAVSDLRTRVRDMRFMRGQGALPLVELSSKPMKTKRGNKIRPEFKIIGWRDAAGNSSAIADPATPQLTSGLKVIEEPTFKEEMRDEVRY
jgi:hypothetical protein